MDLPDKYHNLIKAKAQGVKVPETFFCDEKTLNSENLESILNKFIDQNKNENFIIRSAVLGEDGTIESLAGHFKSSGKIRSENVLSVTRSLYKENKRLQEKYAPSGQVGLMIQPFFDQDFGGVLFSQWKYFKHHFVGEVSAGGAQKAVEGRDSRFFLLSKNTDYEDVLLVPGFEGDSLKLVVQKLEEIFDFPMDIEWGMSEGEIIIFQIRPITRNLESLVTATDTQIKAVQKDLDSTLFLDWQVEAYAESFGILSPASFKLVLEMYEGALPTFRDLGFKAERANFLARLSNGQVYGSPEAQANFFKLESWRTPFWQTFNEAKFLTKIQLLAESLTSKKAFDKAALQKIFNAWQITNFYAASRLGKNPISVLTWPGEYELSQTLEMTSPKIPEMKNWADWRNFYKQAWLYELEKLKKDYAQKPLGVFASKLDYEKDLELSVFDFPTVLFDSLPEAKKRTVVKGDMDLSKAFVVSNPKSFTGRFPQDCVLVSPYFNNDWVGSMDQFSGIILEQGGVLSHSAIVAREKNIPYVIGWEKALETFTQ